MLRELVEKVTVGQRYSHRCVLYVWKAHGVLSSPVMVVRCQYDTGTGVGIAGDPGTVHSKHHEQHQHQHGDYGLDVGAQALLCLLLLRFMLTHLPGLQDTAQCQEAILWRLSKLECAVYKCPISALLLTKCSHTDNLLLLLVQETCDWLVMH